VAEARLFRTILCPVDFSDHSRKALSYAALLTSRAGGRLIVIYVEDTLLAAAGAIAYDEKVVTEKARRELVRFVRQTIEPYTIPLSSITIDVAVGRAWEEIEWTAQQLKCDVIVMGSHGRTGANKLMFGSTTHRMLHRSPLPVLATPPATSRSKRPPRGWPGKRVLAPLDLGRGDRSDVLAAAIVARELDTTLELVHVVEPIPQPPWLEGDAGRRNLQGQRLAMADLQSLKERVPWGVAGYRVESGKPPDKIAAVSRAMEAGLVIMTRRRGQGLLGPRQGAISYQVLCKAQIPVLALPYDRTWMRRLVAAKPK
jgi:nucleotide-binding universal stress UspA family protein